MDTAAFKRNKEAYRPRVELTAALLSGALILAALAAGGLLQVVLFVSAFVIGGAAKAVEGVSDTWNNRRLNVEILMIVAALGAASIGYWVEGAILIFIFSLSGALESYSMLKSRSDITALMNLQPEEAVRIRGGEEKTVPVKTLQLNDTIRIIPGERIPADGTIAQGDTSVDEAAVTGESLPAAKGPGDNVFAGTVNLRGVLLVTITTPVEETLVQKMIELVQQAETEKAPSQQFIERIEGPYVRTVLVTAAFMMVLPPYLFDWSWNETFYRAMVLLVVASPCALVASVTPAALSAISNGARHGILFKGGAHLEQLARIRAVAFDKTGTLTKGHPEVTDCVTRADIDKTTFLQAAAGLEQFSSHPLAEAVMRYAALHGITPAEVTDVQDTAGFGIEAVVLNETWRIGKAAFVGREAAAVFQDGASAALASEGKTILYVQDEKGIAGILACRDVVRKEAQETVRALKAAGIHTVMLTGDTEETAAAIAAELGLDNYRAGCLPETKVAELKQLERDYGPTAMIGDGINDAPALATASIGIAMGGGTDAALATSDVALMKNELSRIVEAYRLSRRMKRVVFQNVVFSAGVILVLLLSNFLQVLALPVGVLGHEGSTILVILNGLRLLRA
ncbi:heavy metal translocating P-type ATPase [Alkalicoccus urumqiensis]|uniref:Cadmium-translocating P-type ATPase n=1 Tax=Alkalicoccus urumqiensis TaxID=1548213 RepID=A0A2P6MLJ4_ALKUR|nr:cadmium-translocating P-type ATPase [Alkalicoccus urumqiensis]